MCDINEICNYDKYITMLVYQSELTYDIRIKGVDKHGYMAYNLKDLQIFIKLCA